MRSHFGRAAVGAGAHRLVLPRRHGSPCFPCPRPIACGSGICKEQAREKLSKLMWALGKMVSLAGTCGVLELGVKVTREPQGKRMLRGTAMTLR